MVRGGSGARGQAASHPFVEEKPAAGLGTLKQTHHHKFSFTVGKGGWLDRQTSLGRHRQPGALLGHPLGRTNNTALTQGLGLKIPLLAQ